MQRGDEADQPAGSFGVPASEAGTGSDSPSYTEYRAALRSLVDHACRRWRESGEAPQTLAESVQLAEALMMLQQCSDRAFLNEVIPELAALNDVIQRAGRSSSTHAWLEDAPRAGADGRERLVSRMGMCVCTTS